MSKAARQLKGRHIDFRPEQVKATFEGRMTQFRRVVKLTKWVVEHDTIIQREGETFRIVQQACEDGAILKDSLIHCPFGRPGERLFVREAFQEISDEYGIEIVAYKAGGHRISALDWDKNAFSFDGEIGHYSVDESEWRSSMHMPRWASRLTLEVESVRVEQLQDISTQDCEAEGIQYPVQPSDVPGKVKPLIQITGKYPAIKYLSKGEHGHDALMRAYFASAWNEANAQKGFNFDSGCWVWAITFRRL